MQHTYFLFLSLAPPPATILAPRVEEGIKLILTTPALGVLPKEVPLDPVWKLLRARFDFTGPLRFSGPLRGLKVADWGRRPFKLYLRFLLKYSRLLELLERFEDVERLLKL